MRKSRLTTSQECSYSWVTCWNFLFFVFFFKHNIKISAFLAGLESLFRECAPLRLQACFVFFNALSAADLQFVHRAMLATFCGHIRASLLTSLNVIMSAPRLIKSACKQQAVAVNPIRERPTFFFFFKHVSLKRPADSDCKFSPNCRYNSIKKQRASVVFFQSEEVYCIKTMYLSP